MARYTHNPLRDPRYSARFRYPKWNIQPSVIDEPRLMKRVFPEMTKADHARMAKKYAIEAGQYQRAYNRALKNAIRKYGDVKGAYVSAVYNPDFPERVKNQLRKLAHGATALRAASAAHWKASGSRTPWHQTNLPVFAEGAASAR